MPPSPICSQQLVRADRPCPGRSAGRLVDASRRPDRRSAGRAPGTAWRVVGPEQLSTRRAAGRRRAGLVQVAPARSAGAFHRAARKNDSSLCGSWSWQPPGGRLAPQCGTRRNVTRSTIRSGDVRLPRFIDRELPRGARPGRRPSGGRRWRGDAQGLGRLGHGQPGEVAELRPAGPCAGRVGRAGRGPRRGPSRSSAAVPAAATVVERTPLAAAAPLSGCLRRAWSTRMRRMASAAAAKKWPRLSQCRSAAGADQPEVGLVDQGGGLEGLARLLLGQPLRRPASAARRRPAAGAASAACGSPCSMADRMWVTSATPPSILREARRAIRNPRPPVIPSERLLSCSVQHELPVAPTHRGRCDRSVVTLQAASGHPRVESILRSLLRDAIQRLFTAQE